MKNDNKYYLKFRDDDVFKMRLEYFSRMSNEMSLNPILMKLFKSWLIQIEQSRILKLESILEIILESIETLKYNLTLNITCLSRSETCSLQTGLVNHIFLSGGLEFKSCIPHETGFKTASNGGERMSWLPQGLDLINVESLFWGPFFCQIIFLL